ncbi:MAG: VirB4-like conjugal transfer ATPase, CD1110 family [Patescibacteria group bacterium]
MIKPIGIEPKKAAEPRSKTTEQVEAEKTKKTIEEQRVYARGVVSILDLVAPSALEVKPDYIRLGSRFIRTLFVLTYPRYISVGWFAPIINYNATLDISMFFYPLKSDIVLKQLRDKVGVLRAQLTADAEKGAPRDPMRETALQDIEQLRDDLTQGIEKFFQFSLYTTLYAKSVKELDDLTEDVEDLFGSKLVFTKRVLYQSEQGFNSTVPIGNDELMISANLNSSPIASSFPFVSSELTSDQGVLFGINRHNNSLIIFDRFTLPNANAVVFATSGAGKSYTIKLEVLRTMMLGTDIMIIDPEREYKHLSDAVGGSYVNISLASESKINPFDLPRPVGEQTSSEDIIRSAVITLKGLIRLMIGDLSYQEDSIIDQALLQTYAKKDITPETDLTKPVEPPLMGDLYEVLEGMEGGHDLALRLKKFTEGTFSGLFNSPTNVDVKNQLVVFSVRDLEDELRPMAIYNIVSHIWNTVRSELRRRILIIDEAWWLMQRKDSADFIYALVKRCRKYYLGVTTITQDVNDFLISTQGKAILQNSAIQFLLRQSPAAIDLVQETFQLTEGERYLLLEAGVGEGIFFAGDRHAAIKVVASGMEDQLITSDPRQLLEIERARKEMEEEMAAGRDQLQTQRQLRQQSGPGDKSK